MDRAAIVISKFYGRVRLSSPIVSRFSNRIATITIPFLANACNTRCLCAFYHIISVSRTPRSKPVKIINGPFSSRVTILTLMTPIPKTFLMNPVARSVIRLRPVPLFVGLKIPTHNHMILIIPFLIKPVFVGCRTGQFSRFGDL